MNRRTLIQLLTSIKFMPEPATDAGTPIAPVVGRPKLTPPVSAPATAPADAAPPTQPAPVSKPQAPPKIATAAQHLSVLGETYDRSGLYHLWSGLVRQKQRRGIFSIPDSLSELDWLTKHLPPLKEQQALYIAARNAELAQSHDTSIALTQRYVEVQTEIGVLNSQQKRIQALCGKIGYDHSHIKNFEQLRADLECIAAALEPRIGLEKKDLEAFVKQLKGGSHITEHTLSRPDELERTIAEATIVPADTVRQLLDRLKPHAETIRLGKKPLHQIDFGMDAPEGYASPIEYAAASIEKLDGIVKKTADALSIDPTQWKASKGPSLGNQVAALRDDFLEMLTPKGTDMTQFSSKTLKEALEILKAIEEQRMLKERASKLAERRVRDKDRRDAKRDAKFAESASWAEYVEHPGANEPGAKTRPPTITRGEGR